MSSAQALANHYLYLCRVVLDAWAEGRAREEVAARVLDDAFAPACHGHLKAAYGWFLLNLMNLDELPAHCPESVAGLPSPPPGQVLSGEIQEFQLLEREGWLADMLGWSPARPGRSSRSAGNLATTAPQSSGPERFAAWREQLEVHFQRMAGAIDEY